MLTIKQVNKDIKERGWNCEIWHNKDDGYYVVDGEDVRYADQTGIYVYRLNHLTLNEWLIEVDAIRQKSKENE